MTLKEHVIKEIVLRVIKSQDYRIEIVNLINAEFLQFAIDFFKKIVIRNDIPASFYDNDGILHATLTDFLLDRVDVF